MADCGVLEAKAKFAMLYYRLRTLERTSRGKNPKKVAVLSASSHSAVCLLAVVWVRGHCHPRELRGARLLHNGYRFTFTWIHPSLTALTISCN